MSVLDPNKEKWKHMYMAMASSIALQSSAIRRKVGAVLVTTSGMISIGWNGTAPGHCNKCEHDDGVTKDIVIHAEENAIGKIITSNADASGSVLYVTCSPCTRCAKLIHLAGIKHVYFRDAYHNLDGVDFLNSVNIGCELLTLDGEKNHEDI